MKRCIFFDRDGTVCEEKEYLDDYRKMVIYPFAIEAFKIFKEKGYNIFIITNQSGVARGKFTILEAERQKKHLLDYFLKVNIVIDGYFYCPHHKEGVIKEYAIDCDCRKPKIGLIKQAIPLNNIDKDNSFMVGDKLIDLELAKNIGIKGVLVLTGYGLSELKKAKEAKMEFIVAKDILDMAMKLDL